MITILRRIRQQLIKENQIKRYTLYAIGEILLVVIGILIALQINNWNENRKKRQQEVNILYQLKEDLIKNKKELQSIYDRQVDGVKAKDSVLFFLENPISHKERLKEYLHNIQFPGGVFNNANTTYKFIESGGINVLSNNDLRGNITIMYETYFKNIQVRWNLDNQLIRGDLLPLLYQHLIPSLRAESMNYLEPLKNYKVLNYPKNPIQLKHNELFINVLTKFQESKILRKYALDITLKKLDDLIQEIENEIGVLN